MVLVPAAGLLACLLSIPTDCARSPGLAPVFGDTRVTEMYPNQPGLCLSL